MNKANLHGFYKIDDDDIDEIINMRLNRASYQLIGEKFNVTRERIRQILKIYAPALNGYVKWDVHYCECGKKISFSRLRKYGECISCYKINWDKHTSIRHKNKYGARYNKIMKMRNRGDTWAKIGHSIWNRKNDNSAAAATMGFIKIYEQRMKALK